MRERLWNQRIEGRPLKRAADVVRWLVASQAQDFAGAKWALGLRSSGLADAAIEGEARMRGMIGIDAAGPTLRGNAAARWYLAIALALSPTCQGGGGSALVARRQTMSPSPDLLEVRHVSVSIHRPPADVYAFAAEVVNLPKWATGLGKAYRQEGEELVAEGSIGSVRVRFAKRNDLGVLDHDVVLESGLVVHNALRVVPNGKGSEVTFVVQHLPGRSDQEFAADCAAVQRDLGTLKELLERSP